MTIFDYLLVVSILFVEGSSQAGIFWRDNWAFGCDFPGNDIMKVYVRGEDCGPKCQSTYRCSHFAWSPQEEGICWLKKGPVSKSQAVSISDMTRVCGVVDNAGAEGIPPSGVQGAPGPRGEKGDGGYPGERGDTGPPGRRGEKGDAGLPGRNGDKGDRGPPGHHGEKGASGLPGRNGEKGDRGPPGHHGEKGASGYSGRPGERGDNGPPGPRGEKGEPGNADLKPSFICLSPTKFDEKMSTMAKEAQTIQQQLTTANAFRSSIEQLTAILQQQVERTCDISTSEVNEATIPKWSFTPPTSVWCPWRSNSCTQKTQQPGQMTIVMEQLVSLPFELHLSTSNNPTDNSYAIHFSIDSNRVQISKTINDITTIINQTTHRDFVLHEAKNKYWLSVDHTNLLIKYGQGEVRDRSTLLRSDVSREEKNLTGQIQFVHVSFSGSRTLADYKWYQNKVKLKIGPYPVLLDPPVLVSRPNDTRLDHSANNSFMLLSRLEKPLQSLYNDFISWKFTDEDFPHLYEAIELSIQTKSGWCYKKLREKASTFGPSNFRTAYLRITLGLNATTSPSVPYVLEIWPPDHYSPIHSHANTYGLIRVLNGEINIKLYRALDLKKAKPIHEMNLHENQVTWLSPGLNQVHRLENKSPNKTCITVQAYEYNNDEVNHYEYFDYINNNGLTINKFDSVSDLDYLEFKELMIAEWNNR